jgi:hypothetical protein
MTAYWFPDPSKQENSLNHNLYFAIRDLYTILKCLNLYFAIRDLYTVLKCLHHINMREPGKKAKNKVITQHTEFDWLIISVSRNIYV